MKVSSAILPVGAWFRLLAKDRSLFRRLRLRPAPVSMRGMTRTDSLGRVSFTRLIAYQARLGVSCRRPRGTGAGSSMTSRGGLGGGSRPPSGATAALALFLAAVAMAPDLSRGEVVSPSQVTPRTLVPAAGPSGAISLTNPAGLAAPANASSLSVAVSNVAVSGGFPELEAETSAITARIRGMRVSVADIFAAANAIEQAYAARGYVLVRVAVPPQKLQNGGTLRLVVIDGFVEGVDAKGVPEKQRALVQARLALLIGERHVTLGEIERRLLLASDIPGLALASTITRGNAPGGGTLLVLEASQSPAVGVLGFDNRLPSSLGKWELNGSVALNSLLGYGEQVYGAASTGYNLGKVWNATTPMQLLGAGFVLPIGVDGFKINPEYTNSVTRPAPAWGAPADVGYYQRFDLRASYPLILTRAQALM